jgi:predicted membrane channel-forming protein YqfA (hemolysin III family)
MSVDDRNRQKKFHLLGWLLFLLCAGFFIASAVEGGSVLGVIGSIIFLVGCVVFIVPLLIVRNRDKDS